MNFDNISVDYYQELTILYKDNNSALFDSARYVHGLTCSRCSRCFDAPSKRLGEINLSSTTSKVKEFAFTPEIEAFGVIKASVVNGYLSQRHKSGGAHLYELRDSMVVAMLRFFGFDYLAL